MSAGSIAAARVATLDSSPIASLPKQQNQTLFARVKSYFSSNNKKESQLPQHNENHGPDPEAKTYLYLAYGSNLNAATFRGRRQVKPLSSTNVVVPEMELVFDLPGIPYTEPAFANSRFRGDHRPELESEKAHLLNETSENGGRTVTGWKKGLVGTVYEVTAEDYAKIILTEGAGGKNGYADILVDCYPLSQEDDEVPTLPKVKSFKAHTLFAGKPRGKGKRQDGWAEPSPRYLGLITSGAAENKLPKEYRDWLDALKPYKPTTIGQQFGRAVVVVSWVPLIMLVFNLQQLLADKHGKGPEWLADFGDKIFSTIWRTYDTIYSKVFGEGERSIEDDTKRSAKGATIRYS